MALEYTVITIQKTSNSQGKTHGNPYRCVYSIVSQEGDEYIAFKECGSVLCTYSIGTKLKVGWILSTNNRGSKEKVIKWFQIFESPTQSTFQTKFGTFSKQEIEKEYQRLISIIGQ